MKIPLSILDQTKLLIVLITTIKSIMDSIDIIEDILLSIYEGIDSIDSRYRLLRNCYCTIMSKSYNYLKSYMFLNWSHNACLLAKDKKYDNQSDFSVK